MDWIDRLEFRLKRFWLEHPIILIFGICVSIVGVDRYRVHRAEQFWEGETATVAAEIVRFQRVSTRRSWIMMVTVKLEDGTTRSFSANTSDLTNCKRGDRVKLERKGNSFRSTKDMCIETLK